MADQQKNAILGCEKHRSPVLLMAIPPLLLVEFIPTKFIG
jgi:hypothetical protein